MIEDHGVSGVLEALARAQASVLAERSYNDEDPYRFHEPFRIEWEDAF